MESIAPRPRRTVPKAPRSYALASVDGSTDVYLVHPWLGARRLLGREELAALVAVGLLSATERVRSISQAHLDVLVDAATRDLEV